MNEPNWSGLPFPTDGSTWRAFARAEGDTERAWVERDACFDFAEQIDRDVLAAFDILGDGVLRWVAKNRTDGVSLDGKTFRVEFVGAPDRRYLLTCHGSDYLLHLSADYYHARERQQNEAHGGTQNDLAAGERRLLRALYPDAPRSRRNIRGPGRPDGRLLKKWII